MKRLTERHAGVVTIKNKNFKDAAEKLAKYEETGLEPEEIHGWIPCSKKNPDELDYYMACIYDEEIDDYNLRKIWFAHTDDYDIEEPEWRELYKFEKVTAWKPLPEPYRGE